LIGPGGLLLVVSHLFAVPVLVFEKCSLIFCPFKLVTPDGWVSWDPKKKRKKKKKGVSHCGLAI